MLFWDVRYGFRSPVFFGVDNVVCDPHYRGFACVYFKISPVDVIPSLNAPITPIVHVFVCAGEVVDMLPITIARSRIVSVPNTLVIASLNILLDDK